jgi:hypothetical protein
MPLQWVAAGTAPASAGKLLDGLALLRGIHDLALPTQVKTGDAYSHFQEHSPVRQYPSHPVCLAAKALP